jgi:hypothetical protein
MADTKISGFPVATTLGTSDIIPIVTGGANKVVSWGSVLAQANTFSALQTFNGGVAFGVPAFVATDAPLQLTGNTNSFFQGILQNTSAAASASTDVIVNNDLGTNTSYYGDFGINSSGFAGTGNFNAPSTTYLYAQNGDLAIGTQTSNAIHFIVGSSTAADAMTISSVGLVTVAGHTVFEGVTSTGATGTGNLVYSASPTLSGTITVQNSLSLGGTAYSFGALPSGATTSGTVTTIPATTYTVTGTNTATAFQAHYFGVPTLTNASAGTVTDLTSILVNGPAVAAGSLIATRVHSVVITDSTQASAGNTGALVVQNSIGSTTGVGIGNGRVFASGLITSSSTITGASVLANGSGGKIGYTGGSGAGGTVTQSTSRSTGVTINTAAGQITGNNASLAAQTAVTFTVTNTSCGVNDVPWLALATGGSTTTSAWVSAVAAGSFNITLFNENTITADTTTPVFNFVIIRGAIN